MQKKRTEAFMQEYQHFIFLFKSILQKENSNWLINVDRAKNLNYFQLYKWLMKTRRQNMFTHNVYKCVVACVSSAKP